MEKWGKTIGMAAGEAKRLVAELFAAAGPARQPHVPELIEMAGRKYGVIDREKIEWLRGQISKLKAHPLYWPRERPEIQDRTRRDLILKLIKAVPGKQADFAYLMRKTGWTLDSVKNQVRRLCDDGELVRVAPGLFTLPGLGTVHVPAREAILAWYRSQPPGTEAKAVELADMLGRPRQAIDAALHGNGRLVADGLVICVRRGVFVLAPHARDAPDDTPPPAAGGAG